jgi:hypothetical protein
MPKLVVQVPRQATASYMRAPVGRTRSWPSGQPPTGHYDYITVTVVVYVAATRGVSVLCGRTAGMQKVLG